VTEDNTIEVRRLRSQMATMSAQNDRLVRTLKDAREQLVTLKAEVDRLANPPAAYGVILQVHDDATADILTGGRKMHVAVSPAIAATDLVPGRDVRLNEALNVVSVQGFERVGEIVLVKELLEPDRVLVVAHADEERVCRVAESIEPGTIRVGDALLLEPRSGFVFERIPKAEVADLVLEEVPDISYEDIGGLRGQIEAIRDSVEIDDMDVGVVALSTTPVKSRQERLGYVGIPVRFGGAEFRPGHFIYVDDDGVLVSERNLLAAP